jgi:hypothetical protein
MSRLRLGFMDSMDSYGFLSRVYCYCSGIQAFGATHPFLYFCSTIAVMELQRLEKGCMPAMSELRVARPLSLRSLDMLLVSVVSC